jgi:beta-lactamase regulating signal transducer with metallopeptidase domain
MGILERSCYSAVLIAVIILIRALTLQKLPKKTFLTLWGIVILRLLLPFSITSPFSIYKIVEVPWQRITDSIFSTMSVPDAFVADSPDHTVYDSASYDDYAYDYTANGTAAFETDAYDYVANDTSANGTSTTGTQASGIDAYQTDIYGTEASVTTYNAQPVNLEFSVPAFVSVILPSIRVVWFIGMCICGLFFLLMYFRNRREFRTSLPITEDRITTWMMNHTLRRHIQIRQSDRIQTPLTYGIIRPIILLPKGTEQLDELHLQFILTHEYVHIRRFDALTKLVFIAALCVHWFNPLVWIMVMLANRDLELSCDETVIRLSGGSTKLKSAYAMTLLDLETEKRSFSPLTSHFNKNIMKERMVSIMKAKRTSIFSLSAAILVVAGIAIMFATKHTEDPDVPGIFPNTPIETIGTDTIINTTDTQDLDHASTGVVQTAVSNTTYDYLFSDYPTKDAYQTGNSTNLTEQIGGPDQLPDKIWTYPNGYQVRTNGEATSPGFYVEFWNEEDYAKWLEEEKPRLQALIGTEDKDHNDTPFTWTQERVDQKIQEYEGYLAEIEQGILLSKTINGNSDVVLKYYPFGKRLGFDKYRMPDNEGFEFDRIYHDGTIVHYGPHDSPRVAYGIMRALVSDWDASAKWEFVE